MKKKFICSVCGYIYEGEAAPEKCPLCKAPASKFTELVEDGAANFATMHVLGAARNEGANEEMIKDLEAHFNGEWDNTHYNIYGANTVARLLIKAVGEQIPQIKSHLRLTGDTVPVKKR